MSFFTGCNVGGGKEQDLFFVLFCFFGPFTFDARPLCGVGLLLWENEAVMNFRGRASIIR